MLRNDFVHAAALFSTLANQQPDQIYLLLRTAYCHEKIRRVPQSIDWYLKAAEAYLEQGYLSEALSTLRMCRRLSSTQGPEFFRILEKCQKQEGLDLGTLDLGLLSPKEKAGRRLRFGKFFVGASGDKLEKVLSLMEHRSLEDGATLCRQDEIADSLYFIVSGELQVQGRHHNMVIPIYNLHAGDIAGEGGYYGNGRRSADLKAVGATELLTLPYRNLEQLEALCPGIKQRIELLYSKRFITARIYEQPLFRGIDYSVLHEICLGMTPVEIKAGTTLFAEGDRSADLYLLRSGYLAILHHLNDREHMVGYKSPGDLVGETAAINRVRTATLRAVTDCQLLMLGEEEYLNMCANFPELNKRLADKRKELLHASRTAIRQNTRFST